MKNASAFWLKPTLKYSSGTERPYKYKVITPESSFVKASSTNVNSNSNSSAPYAPSLKSSVYPDFIFWPSLNGSGFHPGESNLFKSIQGFEKIYNNFLAVIE